MRKKFVSFFVILILISTVVLPLSGKMIELKNDFKYKNLIEFTDKNLIYKEYYPGVYFDLNICYYYPDQVIIGFEKSFDVSSISEIDGYPIIDCIDHLNAVLVEIKDVDLELFINQINCRENIRYAELNLVTFGCDIIPDDEYWNEQWGHVMINCPYAWDITTGKDVNVAVLDTGIDSDHEDFCSDKIPYGWNAFNETIWTEDDHGHGTRCSGIIGACFNNGVGIAGVAPDCKIIPIKVLDENNTGSIWTISKGIIFATYYGHARIISMSFVSPYSYLLEDACRITYEMGSVLVAASGNSYENEIYYPAKFPTVIAVGAIDENKEKCDFSNYGPELDFVAPGINIITTSFNNTYSYFTGTSASTAYVSGIIALLYEVYPFKSPEYYKNKLICSIQDLPPEGWDEKTGYGLIYFDNLSPTEPIITGVINGKVGTPYPYIFNSTDPEGEDVSYYIKWGDGKITDWTAYQSSGTKYFENHTWAKKGNYTIKVKAKDINGSESNWAYHVVTMPRDKLYNFNLLEWLFECFPNVFPILRYIYRDTVIRG